MKLIVEINDVLLHRMYLATLKQIKTMSSKSNII